VFDFLVFVVAMVHCYGKKGIQLHVCDNFFDTCFFFFFPIVIFLRCWFVEDL
jgi:hypothetical protein